MAKKRLGEIVSETRQIPLGGDDFIEVRGVSMADVQALFKKHTASLTRAFDDLMDNRIEGTISVAQEELNRIVQETLISAPDLVGDIIATAMDQPDQGREAAKLRVGVQIQALLTIAELSITSEAELKNVLGAASKIISRATALFQAAKKSRTLASH